MRNRFLTGKKLIEKGAGGNVCIKKYGLIREFQ